MSKIMIVDDAPEVTEMIAAQLRGAGHQVLAYNDGQSLEDKVELEKPDLLLLDIVMPGRDGYQILRSLKKRPGTQQVPVILVSSKGEATDVAWGKMQGADDYVTKPFTATELLSTVGRWL